MALDTPRPGLGALGMRRLHLQLLIGQRRWVWEERSSREPCHWLLVSRLPFSLSYRTQPQAESAITRDHVVFASLFHGPEDTTDSLVPWE